MIFSEDEIRQTVKRFVLAWLRGEITIHFPSAEEFFTRSTLMKQKTDFRQASESEILCKGTFIEQVSICVGNKKATSEEREEAIDWLFKTILSLRSAERVEGRFTEFDIEERFLRIEERIKALNTMVQELIIVVNAMREGRKHS